MMKICAFIIAVLITWNSLFASIDFDNADDSISAGDIAAIDGATSLSISLWVYHDTVTGDDAIINKRDGIGVGFTIFRDDVCAASGRTDCYTFFASDSDTNNRIETATNSSVSGAWTHLVFTLVLNTASGFRVYINGVEDANSPVSSVNITTIDSGTIALLVGVREAVAGGGSTFDGRMDELRIWTRILSASEVASIYNARLKYHPNSTTSTVLCWPMDDQPSGTSADGDTIMDVCLGNNGTGSDGANNTGLTWGSGILSYPPKVGFNP